MKGLTNKGFSKVEFMIGLCTILVLLAIGVKVLFSNNDNSRYSMLKRQAENFAYKVGIYKDKYPRSDQLYYLDYLLEDNYATDLANPFQKDTNCDRYESYVEITSHKKLVSLKCDHYLAVGEEGGTYSIYELGDWQEQELDGEYRTLYNYQKNGVEMNDTYLLEKEFLATFNQKEKKKINELSEVEENEFTLVQKNFYRSKKLIKEI